MGLGSSARRRTRAVRIVVLLYALVVVASPLLHHDFDCHLKSAQHCIACLSQPLGSTSGQGAPLLGPGPIVAESVVPAAEQVFLLMLEPRALGRAPPAAA